jgi:hypothetical protein
VGWLERQRFWRLRWRDIQREQSIMPTCKALDHTTLEATAVSFKDDVFSAIIRQTRNSSACHGVALAQSTGVYPG